MHALALSPDEAPTIGQRLLAVVTARGWSLRRLSNTSGVSVSQLSLLTRDRISHPRISTIRAICAALEIPEVTIIGSYSRATHHAVTSDGDLLDRQAFEGVTVVPEVTLGAGGTLCKTGRTLTITASQLNHRDQVYVAVVDGGGMMPHVLIGDKVLFDPSAAPESGQLVLLRHGAATLTAWRINHGDQYCYGVSDGTWLRPEDVQVAGAIVFIMRQPPRFHAP